MKINDSDSCVLNDSLMNETTVQFLPIKPEDGDDKPESQLVIDIPEYVGSETISSTLEESNNTVMFIYGSHLLRKFVNKEAKTRKCSRIKRKKTINGLNSSESTDEQNIESPLSNELLQTSSTTLYKCDVKRCKFTSFNTEEWIKHNDTHEVIAFKCKICKKSFSKKNRLEAHQRLKEHLDEYKCSFPDCNRKFVVKYGLINHYNATHMN